MTRVPRVPEKVIIASVTKMSLNERFSRMKSVVGRSTFPTRSAAVGGAGAFVGSGAHMDVDLRTATESSMNPRGRSFLYDDYMDNDLNGRGLTAQAQARLQADREAAAFRPARAGPSRLRTVIAPRQPRGYVDLDAEEEVVYAGEAPVRYVVDQRPRFATRPRPRPRQVVTEVVEIVQPPRKRFVGRQQIVQKRHVPIEQRLSIVKQPLSKRLGAAKTASPAVRKQNVPVKSAIKPKTGRIVKKKAVAKPKAAAKPKFEKKKPATKEDLDKELEEYMRKSKHTPIDVSDL